MLRLRRTLLLSCALIFSACAAPRLTSPMPAPHEGFDAESAPAAAVKPATFAQLIAELPGMEPNERSSPLFKLDGDDARLHASPLIPIRPIPPLESGLSARLSEAREAQIFSHYGVSGESPLKVATLSRLARPFDRALVIALEGDRLYFRDGRFTPAALLSALDAESLDETALLILIAAPTTALRALAELALVLEARFKSQLAIGVLLPRGTRYERPQELPPSAQAEWRCGEGDRMQSEGPFGALDPASLRPSLEALHEAVARCAKHAPPSTSGEERRYLLRIKVGGQGEVDAACFAAEDEAELLSLDHFARCAIRELREISFPRPDPEGEVFLTLPLRFTAR